MAHCAEQTRVITSGTVGNLGAAGDSQSIHILISYKRDKFLKATLKTFVVPEVEIKQAKGGR